MGKSLSDEQPNTCGVYQGSCLGPLLFSIVVNDMLNYVGGATLVQYADDSQLIVHGKASEPQNMIQTMENSLRLLSDWFASNGLKMNADKTQLMVFGTRQQLRRLGPVKVALDDENLEPVECAKNLGVLFDPHLSWHTHVDMIVSRCTGILVALSHHRNLLPHEIMTNIVQTLVLPHIRYCLTVIAPMRETQKHRLEKIMNFAARVISGRKKYDHISDVKRELEWLSIEDQIRYNEGLLMYKVLLNETPKRLYNLFKTNSSIHDIDTRSSQAIHLPLVRSEAGKSSMSYRAAKNWNSLPLAVRSAPTIGSWKSAAKTHFIGLRASS